MVLTKAYAWAYLLPLCFFFLMRGILEKRKISFNPFLILAILVYPFTSPYLSFRLLSLPELLKRFEGNNQWVEIYMIRGDNK